MKSLLRSKIPLLLLSFFLIAGCSKEDAFKNPTPVVFNVGMDPQGVSVSDDLTFSDGYIVINRFSVIGDRTVGEDFEFTRTFPNGLRIPFDNNLTFEDLSFELPQGEYNRLRIRFETARSNQSNLFVEGMYIYNNPLKTPSTVHLAWNTNKTFEVDVLETTGNRAIILNEAQKETPKIIIKPKPWFADVTILMLENASFLTTPSGRQIMTIDQNNNTDIFTRIDAKLGTALECSL